jgi:hypothetical protein
MDTSCILCPITDIRITLCSVMQTRTFCLWDKSPYLPSVASLCAICTKGQHQYGTIRCVDDSTNGHTSTLCADCTDFWKCLDVIESREYDDIEKQGNKNGSRNFQGPGTIQPDRWETLFNAQKVLSTGLSPCNGIIYNCIHLRLDSGIIHRASFQSICFMLWFERMSGFFVFIHRSSSRMKTCSHYMTCESKLQVSLYITRFSYCLTSAESEGRQW